MAAAKILVVSIGRRHQVLALAVGCKCTNIEIYPDDLENLSNAIAYAHNALVDSAQKKTCTLKRYLSASHSNPSIP